MATTAPRVLLIDPSRTRRAILAKLVREHGVVADEANSLEDGLVRLGAAAGYRAVFLAEAEAEDQFAPAGRRLRTATPVPLVVAMTAAGERPRGADAVLKVPFDAATVAALLDRCAGRGAAPATGPATRPTAAKQNVLVVDDSVVVRGVVRRLLDAEPDMQVAAVASDGRTALDQIRRSVPDVVLLDIEMPRLDGLETLAQIRLAHPRLPVVMFSSLTERGAAATVEALIRGADDYVHKPGGSRMNDPQAAREVIRTQLIPKIRQFAAPAGGAAAVPVPPAHPATDRVTRRAEVVVVAVSTGGPKALAVLLPSLLPAVAAPVLVVQHMPAGFTAHLADRLAANPLLCADGVRRVHEAREGETPLGGHAYLAAGGRHLAVVERDGRLRLHLTDAAPENSCRPSADVLFRSAAAAFGSGALGVVLTGMGRDGLAGSRTVCDAGGQVLVQDEASSVIWGMPQQVWRAGLAEQMVPLDQMALEIGRRVRRGRPRQDGNG